MHLQLKSPFKTFEVEVDDSITVSALRALAAEKFDTTVDKLFIIFSGKVVRDTDSLADQKIVSGATVHIMIRAGANNASNSPKQQSSPTVQANAPTNSSPAPMSTPTSSPSSTSGIFGLSGLGSAAQILGDGELMNRLLNNPSIQQLFSDPLVMESIIKTNPQLKALAEKHPEINNMLRDPATLKQITEIMKNPALYQETLRSNERLLSQLELIPGGLSHVTRLISDMGRTSASQNQDTSNPFTTLRSSASSSSSPPLTSDRTQANTDGTPMPNPWAPQEDTMSQASQKSSTAQGPNANTIRDFERLFNFGGDNANNSISQNLLNQIREGINKLMPRSLYGMTEFLKGLEVLRDDNPQLVALIFNYYFVNVQLASASNEVAAEAENRAVETTFTEESLQQQLTELQSMGFSNKEENIQALRYSFGDVNGAVDWILRRRGNF